jgi:hypothetical protein
MTCVEEGMYQIRESRPLIYAEVHCEHDLASNTLTKWYEAAVNYTYTVELHCRRATVLCVPCLL